MNDAWPIDQRTIAAIGAMTEGGVRNRLITQTYHRLACEIGRLTEPATTNWFHFGVWASFSVGQIMRGETLPPWVRRVLVGDGAMLGDGDHRFAVIAAVEHAAATVAADLAEGNVSVFREMAPAGAAFVASQTGTPAERDDARAELAAICARAQLVRGTNCLERGFAAFAEAVVEPDVDRRTQLVLAGSIHLGAAEQSRLDPVLRAVLSAAPDDVLGPIERHLRLPLLRRLARAGDRVWDRAMTRHVLVLVLPGERLRLGHDVPALPGLGLLPACVADPQVEALREVLEVWDRTHGAGRGDAARNWAELGDRMTWIGWLFRSRVRDARLAEPPFPGPELAALEDLLAG